MFEAVEQRDDRRVFRRRRRGAKGATHRRPALVDGRWRRREEPAVARHFIGRECDAMRCATSGTQAVVRVRACEDRHRYRHRYRPVASLLVPSVAAPCNVRCFPCPC